MTLVKDWIAGFLTRHQARFPGDWPNDDFEVVEFKRLWLSALVRNGVDEAEADEASRRMAESPPTWRRDHIPALLAMVKAVRAGVADGVETRDTARQASKDCPHCGGSGLSTAWHPRPDPAKRSPRTVAAYCECRAGRWIKRNHASSRDCLDVAKGFPDYAEILAGRSPWLADDPQLPS